ncbi:MAG: holo-ACP synthase [Anaerolineae bacterium]|nr:holo-ACP synthase [Anaerolineae bacterium]MDW8299770.1 holo-ACP synthase [Anaerolineae bacterium]
MPALRVGVDIIEVERVRRAVARHGERFYARFFTPRERQICAEQPLRLAARFAAKEAAAKALGTGIGTVRWVDLEIDCDERGRPILRLHGAAAELAQQLCLTTWEVSLSHTETHAIAFVVALG